MGGIKNINSVIIGTGAYLPEFVLSNDMYNQTVETSDEWITSRTGIKERRIEQEKYNFELATIIYLHIILLNRRSYNYIVNFIYAIFYSGKFFSNKKQKISLFFESDIVFLCNYWHGIKRIFVF